MLNYIWTLFFLISIVSIYIQTIVSGVDISQVWVEALFEMASLSVKISFGLIGALCFWMGMFQIAQAAGLIEKLSQKMTGVFSVLMPKVPKGHESFGAITMNMSANILGLDNAATPLGIKAMQSLQGLNTGAMISNAQILFMVLNTTSVTLFPMTIIVYRAELGANQPADVMLPILIATSCSTLVGLSLVAWRQKLQIFRTKFCLFILLYVFLLIGVSLLTLTSPQASEILGAIGNLFIITLIGFFLVMGLVAKIDVYDEFIQGAKQGFGVAVQIIPYLVAMLVAIGVLRASGVFDAVISFVASMVNLIGFDEQFLGALPTALMKPFSGSGARAMMLEAMNTYGVDSLQARMAAIMQGSTETTFYVIAVYLGAAGVKHTRYLISTCLMADVAGCLAAIGLGYLFFG